jgi:hypothetical protein
MALQTVRHVIACLLLHLTGLPQAHTRAQGLPQTSTQVYRGLIVNGVSQPGSRFAFTDREEG